ncbi:MAG: 3-deoxy-D-manno-octulosonic acid transferase [Candidatus Magnetominusculus sp. LBB02]|nr:3-deoxy-D-manno-octulosonic acid transferase [Candidatus Magnetominusculus sp. LBB02]
MALIYRILYLLALMAIVPAEYFKRPKELRRRWFLERSGVLPDETGTSPTVWIHAVSVGEAISAIPLIRRIAAEITPHIVLSTVTDTGQQTAREKLPDDIRIVYVPFDTSAAVSRAIKAVNPRVFIVMETELWPCIIDQMHRRNIPVVILNGRISEKSFKGYRKIRFFMKNVLRNVTLFGMQDAVYSERIIEMGADKNTVKTLGNFKFDAVPPATAPQWALVLTHPVIVIGSTHEKEEAIILSVIKRLMAEFETLCVVLAPRHPARFDEAASILNSFDMPFIRRSEIAHMPKAADHGMVVLLDTIGELASVYGAADVCVMGGSFVPKGGHNLLEPAYWGKPIVCGPHMENFPMTGEFLAAHAAVSAGSDDLYDILSELLSNEAKRAEMGRQAQALYRKNSGAIDSAVRELKTIMGV